MGRIYRSIRARLHSRLQCSGHHRILRSVHPQHWPEMHSSYKLACNWRVQRGYVSASHLVGCTRFRRSIESNGRVVNTWASSGHMGRRPSCWVVEFPSRLAYLPSVWLFVAHAILLAIHRGPCTIGGVIFTFLVGISSSAWLRIPEA